MNAIINLRQFYACGCVLRKAGADSQATGKNQTENHQRKKETLYHEQSNNIIQNLLITPPEALLRKGQNQSKINILNGKNTVF